MKRMKIDWLLLLVPLLLTGCALPVQVESRVDPDYLSSLERVYVISQLYVISDRFAEPCERFIVEELTAAGVGTRMLSMDPLVLDDELPLDEAVEFSPEGVLIVRPTEKGGPGWGNVTMATIHMTLRDLTTDTVYWRAEFSVRSGDERTPMGSATARQLAKTLVRRLGEDGLLSSSI